MRKINFLIFSILTITFFDCEDCECLDDDTDNPSVICNKSLLVQRNNPAVFSLDTIASPLMNPISFNPITTSLITNPTRPSQFDAYSENSNNYVFISPDNSLTVYDTQNLTTNSFSTSINHVAPIYNNDILYTLWVETTGVFAINTLDDTSVVSSTFGFNFDISDIEPIDGEFMSSTTDGNNLIYFVYDKYLIEYTISLNQVSV